MSRTSSSPRPSLGDDTAHFLAIPWCRALLRPLDAESSPTRIQVVVPTTRRQGYWPGGKDATASETFSGHAERQQQKNQNQNQNQTPPQTQDGFRRSNPAAINNIFLNTLNTPDGISDYVVFYRDAKADSTDAAPPLPIVELSALMTVGPGLGGHVGYLHGGAISLILDEVVGLLIPLNWRRRQRYERRRSGEAKETLQVQDLPSPSSPAEAAAARATRVRAGVVTAYLNTTYLRPVPISSTILVTTRFLRAEGTRKFLVNGTICDEKGRLYAKAEALLVQMKANF